jgi:hypothetical protein
MMIQKANEQAEDDYVPQRRVIMMISSSKSQDEDDFTPKTPLRYNGQNKEGGEDTKCLKSRKV